MVPGNVKVGATVATDVGQGRSMVEGHSEVLGGSAERRVARWEPQWQRLRLDIHSWLACHSEV